MAKYPEYKTKYKSLGLKDKVVAKYYSTGGAKFNKLVKDVAENTPLPGVGLIAKGVPKATRIVKELATKFTQSKRTLQQPLKGVDKTRLNNLNNKVHAKLDSAQKLKDAAMNKAMEKAYRPKFEKPTQEMIDKAGPVTIIKPKASNLGKSLKSSRVPDPGSWDDVPWQGRDILKIKKPRKK